MLNSSFENGTVTIYKTGATHDGLGFYEGKTIIHDNIPCQICCSKGQTSHQGCEPRTIQTKDIEIKIKPTYILPVDCKRNDFILEVNDSLGCMGTYRVDDIVPVKMPSSGLYAISIKAFRNDG